MMNAINNISDYQEVFMKKRLLMTGLSLLLLSSLILGGCTRKAADPSGSESFIGSFTSITHTGDSVDQTILEQADLTMLNVWTTFCGYCIEEMPTLQSLSETYKGQGLQIIGIVSDVTTANDATVQDILDTAGVTYPQILASDELRDGFLGDIQSVPTTIFVDSSGQIIGKPYVGMRDKEGWTSIIDQSLELVQ